MTGKAANMADWIESRIHLMFTDLADNLLGDGRITRDERIALSGAIGTSLDVFHTALQQEKDLLPLYRRGLWDEADPTSPQGSTYPGALIRAGRRLSSKQLERLQEARRTIDDLVSWANYEDGGGGGQDGEDTDPSAKVGAVKSLGGDRIGGHAVLWGSPTKRDLMDEFFTTKTAELTAIFDVTKRLPLLYEHAIDGKLMTTVVGLVDKVQADEVGLWYEAQLTMAGKYRAAIDELIGQGLLGTSSGTLPAARRVDRKTGQVLRWPVVEISLTPRPAEPRMMERPVAEIKAAFAAIGFVDVTGLDGENNGDYAKAGAEEPAESGGEPLPAKELDEAGIRRELLALDLMTFEV